MRTFLLNIGLMGGLFLLWYSYAPIDHKMRVPTEVRQTFSALDGLATASVHHLTALVDEVSEQPGSPVEGKPGPLLIASGNDTVEIYGERPTGEMTAAPPHPDMFAGLSLRNATLAESRLDGYTLDFTDLRGAAIANVSLQKVKGQDTRFDGALLHRADFSRASLRRARFDQAIMAHTIFEGSEVIEGSFSDAVMRGGSLSGATMAGSRFDRTRFERTDLRQVDLSATSFREAVFLNTRLHGSSLAAANLSGADLTTAFGLTQDQLDRACGDEATLLPEGLTVPSCTAAAPTRLAQN